MAAKQIDLAQLPVFLHGVATVIDRGSYKPALQRCKIALVSATKQSFDRGQAPDGSPWPSLVMPRPRGGDRPLRDRGILMASVTGQGHGNVEEITETSLVWGTNLDYARTHQDGDTIRPKKGRALAIPLTPEAVRTGSPTRFAGLVLIWQRGARSGVLAERSTGGVRGRAHYLLVKSVTVRPRPFLGWTPELADKCNLIFADFVEEELEKL